VSGSFESNLSFQSSCSFSSRIIVAYNDVFLVEHNFYVDTGMALNWNWLMVIQEILAAMNKGGKSVGKVHYVGIDVSTAFWGFMVLRVFS
jgi:hypothetical protein